MTLETVLAGHPAIDAIAAYWIYSAVVGGMPAPDANSSKFYIWIHNSLHILAGNLSAAVAAKYPNLPTGGTVAQEHTEKTTTTIAPTTEKPPV